MRQTETITINPHPDIELGASRQPIDAYLTFPENGLDDDTGIVFILGDFEEFANNKEQKDELAPYIADKFNCIAVGVNFFGILRKRLINMSETFFHNFNRIYNLNLDANSFQNAKTEDEVFRVIAESIINRGITSLDIRCQPSIITGRNEYQSWGFLPAIDCLQVLGGILNSYQINTRKIIALGKGYGAYVALLMGKYAPHTFSVIVDWGGYMRTELKHVVPGQVMDADYVYAFNIRHSDLKFTISAGSNNPWTIEDELSPLYFADSHRKIRSLLLPAHKLESQARYYCLHSDENDQVAIEEKDRFVELQTGYNRVYYNRLPSLDLESELRGLPGLPVKDYKHYQYYDLADWVSGDDPANLEKEDENTDFSRESTHEFDCGGKKYRFVFNKDNSLNVVII